jgi:hypothetical protein
MSTFRTSASTGFGAAIEADGFMFIPAMSSAA